MLDELAADQDLPLDVADAWQVLAGTDIESLAGDPAPSNLGRLFETFLGEFSDRQREILLAGCAANRFTPGLEWISRTLNVTVERARQLDSRIYAHIRRLLGDVRYAGFEWNAHRLRRLLGTSLPVGSDLYRSAIECILEGAETPHRDELAGFLVATAGYRQVDRGWLDCLRPRGETALFPTPPVSLDDLEAHANQYGVVEWAQATAVMTAAGVREEFHGALVARLGLRDLGSGVALWRGNVVDKAVAVLDARRAPATTLQLVDAIGEGHSLSATSQRLAKDPRLVQVLGKRWALSTWTAF